MTTLNLEEIEKFRGLRLSDLEIESISNVLGRITLERLQLKEKELTKNGYGLPFYLALQYHIKGRTLKDLGEELGVSYDPLVRIFKDHKIPRLDPSESKIRYLKEHGDPRKRRQKKINRNRFFDGEKRKEIIKAYDHIYNRTDFNGGWRELIKPVSEETDIELKVVTSCLEDLFGVKVG